MAVNLEIQGLDKLAKKMDKMSDIKVINAGIKLAGEHIAELMRHYPPPPATSTYRRTGTLKQGWTEKMLYSRMSVIVGNQVPYAPAVQSGQEQVWYHKRTGWQTDQKVIDQERDKISDYVAKEIEHALEKA